MPVGMIDERTPTAAEKALLVGLYIARDLESPDLMLDELESLVEAAGGLAVGRSYQRRAPAREHATDGPRRADRPVDPGTFIGRGKAEQVAALAEATEADLVVFDNELSPAQIRELEKIIKRKIIDRSELILDIFASRARTRAAKLQVELAQLEYTAPRLRGLWTHLERQVASGGPAGVGTRGPGEKQIEIDRRIVSQRITKLKRELGNIHGRREREVASRTAQGFTVGLVGYTNAGKSTLMNAVTAAATYSADQLFATLDTKTRRWQLEPGVWVMLSDTVGFVRDLPHMLVASFRSTLEEALNADLLLHVIDASHPQAVEQVEAVEAVLAELGCSVDDILCVLNKVDRVTDEDALAVLRQRLPAAVCVSALTGAGLDELIGAVAERRCRDWIRVRVRAPVGDGKLQAFVRARAHVEHEAFDEEAWTAELELSPSLVPRLRELSPDADVQVRSRPTQT
jgi:GTPase